MGSGNPVAHFGERSSMVVIEDTLGCMDHTYRAYLNEPFICGTGDSHEDAVRSMIEGMQKQITELALAARKHFAKAVEPIRTLDIDIDDGHKYQVQVSPGGKVIATACKGRWPMTHTSTGSVWLDEQLQSAATKIILNEKPHRY